MIDEQLLFRAWRGETTPEEEQAVAQWRAADRANEARYRQLGSMLEAVRRAHPLPISKPPSALEVLEEAARRGRHGWQRRRIYWATGAVAAAVFLALWLVPRRLGPNLAISELVTAAGETTTVGLTDGTVVRLAPSSRLRFRPDADGREVELAGRAFFAVAKRAGRQFRVRTQAGELVVLGTRFDVDARETDLRTVVVEGRVAVSAAGGGETRVSAGQLSRVVNGRLLPTVRIPDVGRETKWVGRFLAFQNTPLDQVGREIERVYGGRVVVDSAVADRTITTWLADRSLDEVVRIVCAVSVTSCSTRDGVVSILGS